MTTPAISADDRDERRRIRVLDSDEIKRCLDEAIDRLLSLLPESRG